jgi:hypothetical protein
VSGGPTQFPHQPEVKAGDFGTDALALAGGFGGAKQVIEADQPIQK